MKEYKWQLKLGRDEVKISREGKIDFVGGGSSGHNNLQYDTNKL